MRVLPYGDRAFMLEFDDVQQVIEHHAAILAADPPGIVELVPAARTILIQVDQAMRTLDDVMREVCVLEALSQDADRPTRLVEIPIRYDGPTWPTQRPPLVSASPTSFAGTLNRSGSQPSRALPQVSRTSSARRSGRFHAVPHRA